MAREQPRPASCPATKWCDKGNFPCYCEDAPAPINPGDQPSPPIGGDRR